MIDNRKTIFINSISIILNLNISLRNIFITTLDRMLSVNNIVINTIGNIIKIENVVIMILNIKNLNETVSL